jgi:hypothetical protein
MSTITIDGCKIEITNIDHNYSHKTIITVKKLGNFKWPRLLKFRKALRAYDVCHYSGSGNEVSLAVYYN